MSGMNQHEITLTFTPTNTSANGLPLEDFLQQLDAFRQALSFADRLANNMEHACFTYQISGLSMNSPATVSLDPVLIRNDCGAAIFDPGPMLSTIWKLYAGEQIDAYEIRYFEGLRPLAEALRHSPTSSIDIHYAGEEITVPGNLKHLIDGFEYPGVPETAVDHIQPGVYEMYAQQEIRELGSVVGRLEAVNFHQGDCGIYTPFSSRPVKCVFPDILADVIQSNLRRRVEAFGKIHTPAGKSFPDKIEIMSIESIPEESVRSLRSMRGAL